MTRRYLVIVFLDLKMESYSNIFFHYVNCTLGTIEWQKDNVKNKNQTYVTTCCFNVPNNVGADSTPRAPMGEDRASYRREGGPGGADKRGEAGAGATQSFQFVSKSVYH